MNELIKRRSHSCAFTCTTTPDTDTLCHTTLKLRTEPPLGLGAPFHCFAPQLAGALPRGPLGLSHAVSSASPPGFQLSSHLLQLIVLRYADEELQLCFDDFLNCLVRLENASRECPVLSPRGESPSPSHLPGVCKKQPAKAVAKAGHRDRCQICVMSVGSGGAGM